MSVIVGWLVSANCADTLTVLGDKFVIGKEFLRPWNRKITTNWKKMVTKKLFRYHSHSEGPYGSATARNRDGNVQVIVRQDNMMRLSFLRE